MSIDDRKQEEQRLEAKSYALRMEIKKKTGRVDDIKSRPGDEIAELNNVEMHLGFNRIQQRLDRQDEEYKEVRQELEVVRDVAYKSSNIIDAVWWIISIILVPACIGGISYIGFLLYTYIEFKVKTS